jgi:hypothetical protein
MWCLLTIFSALKFGAETPLSGDGDEKLDCVHMTWTRTVVLKYHPSRGGADTPDGIFIVLIHSIPVIRNFRGAEKL